MSEVHCTVYQMKMQEKKTVGFYAKKWALTNKKEVD